MCNKTSPTGRSSVSIQLAKLTAVLVFLCFAECAAGSCISYGHSCWGAHGKRNDAGLNKNNPIKADLTSGDLPSDTRWFLSRLLQGNDPRFQKERDAIMANPKIFLKEFNDEDEKSADEVDDYQEAPQFIDSMFPEKIHPRLQGDKLRFIKFIKTNRLN